MTNEELKDKTLQEEMEETLETVEDISSDNEEQDKDTAEDTVESEPELSEVEKLQAENEVLADKVLRAQAELQNVQRRQAKERQDLLKYRSQDLAKKILPSLDNLERALQVDGLSDDVKKGIEMVQESLLQALKEESVSEVTVDTFDPNLHMAVQTIPATDEQPADSIAQVLQKGYILHDRLLRPAMVIISQ